MVLQNHNTVAARAIITATNTESRNQNYNREASYSRAAGAAVSGVGTPNRLAPRMSAQRPIIDLLVTIIALPTLILCGLQLEKHLHDMHNSPDSKWLVFALGIGILIVSIVICGYVTHRMGVCIWTGPIEGTGHQQMRNHSTRNLPHHINSQNDVLQAVDTLPPSYDSVVKFDIPPPPYECLTIDIESDKQDQQTSDKTTVSTVNSAVHI